MFLDFDGVINTHGGTAAGAFSDPACVANVNRVLDATNAKIVVCSSWRYLVHRGYMTIGGLVTLLRTHGLYSANLIDVTRASRDTGDMQQENEPRWRQIADWLKRPLCSVGRYAIIDDDPDAFGGRPGVQTDPTRGFTEQDAERAIEILAA
jgi:hypothetical protein